jgi:hypothetical protein
VKHGLIGRGRWPYAITDKNKTRANIKSPEYRAFYMGRNALYFERKYTNLQIFNIPAEVRKRMNMITGTTYLIMTL